MCWFSLSKAEETDILKSWDKTSFSGLSACSVPQLHGSAGHCGSTSVYWCLRQFFSSAFGYADTNVHA